MHVFIAIAVHHPSVMYGHKLAERGRKEEGNRQTERQTERETVRWWEERRSKGEINKNLGVRFFQAF